MSVENKQDIRAQLKAYGDKLLGLIPAEKIKTLSQERVAMEIVERFKALPDLTSTVADILDTLGIDTIIPATELKPISTGRVVGSALTLRYIPTQEGIGASIAKGHKAPLLGGKDIITLSQAGDVLVIESRCQYAASAFGGIMATAVQEAGIAGVVVEGNIRDVANMRDIGLQAWSRGITPRTGKHRIELAEMNGSVELAGVHVAAGDLILADSDGVVVVPVRYALDVLQRAERAVQTEGELISALQKGASSQEVANILSPDRW
ncbi:RraA family protein [Alcaligenes endophyticus]|uniref:RraA family protein n=1 Tax=Alcaligenes endophyticus TaxID=1929088 RepID=A0ABT8EGE5_9BURK|nr:RraA family protein [Alcaligenes endophyticus]MCX5590003.1 RraA family protein [Alcaligenes endophyticus]MDN4120334.1 RraA family protein [Alcaligenes endophyticus]